MENDFTVHELFQRIFENETLLEKHFLDPFLSGIWAGDIKELSAKSALSGIITKLRDERISKF